VDDVVKAIQEKYGISRTDSKKVVDALVAIEKEKRMKTSARRKAIKPASDSKGLLDDLGGGLLGGQNSDELLGLVGGVLGSQAGGDLNNLVGGILGGQQGQQGSGLGDMLGGILGGGQQGRSDLFGIVSDLLGSGAGQAAGLAGIVGALLVGQGNSDVMDTVNGLLGRSTPEKPAARRETPTSTPSASDRLRKLSAAAKNQPLEINGDDILDRDNKKKR